MSEVTKERLDLLLVEQDLFPSRSRAQEMIRGGKVRVEGLVVIRPGARVLRGSLIEVDGPGNPYVSRGGLKLEGALEAFEVLVHGKVALDVGASTGGFTDCLLSRGVQKVYCVDVGRGQLAEQIRRNSKVQYWESCHIKDFSPDRINEIINIIVVDVSFISLRKVIPYLAPFLERAGEIVALVKPQFEVGRKKVNKRGIVTDTSLQKLACEDVANTFSDYEFEILGLVESEITGVDGNQEYFLYARKS